MPQRGFPWPKTRTLYHATGGLRALLSSGFLTRAELGGKHFTGGGPDVAISFTLDIRVARAICVGLRTLARGTRGELGIGDLIIQAGRVNPSSIEGLKVSEQLKTPEAVSKYDQGLYPFHSGMGWNLGADLSAEQLEQVVELAGDEVEIEEHYADPRATKPYMITGWAPAAVIAAVDSYRSNAVYRPKFYGSYNYLLGMGGSDVFYNPVFFATSLDAVSQLVDDDIGIVKCEVDADWLCATPRDAESLGYDPAEYDYAYWAYGSDWARGCDQHLGDIVAGKTYGSPRPPVADWAEPDPSDTISYLGRSMAEVRVYDGALVRNLTMAEDVHDVVYETVDAWQMKGEQFDEPLFYPHFRTRPGPIV